MRLLTWIGVLAAIGACAVSPRTSNADAGDPPSDSYTQAFEARDYRAAKADLQRQINADPTDKFLLYNLACAHAMLGERDDAVEALLDALSLGFVDFALMERDDHLDAIRDHPKYRTIVANWRLVLDTRADAELAALREVFGEQEYDFEKDGEARVLWISGFPERAFESARQEVGRVVAWAAPLFDEPVPDPNRPDPWVQLVLPTTPDFLRMVGPGTIGGFYDRDNKRLISRDIGPGLRHEFFHALHWRHMDRLGQRHPIWLQEGLASLLEDIDAAGDEGLTIRPSWRTNIARRLSKFGGLTPWERFFTMSHADFVQRRPRSNYAQARAVAMFLHERGVLEEWYDAYVAGFDEDPTGLTTMGVIFEKPVADVQRDFRTWLLALEEVADIDRPKASLGVALGQGRGDGPVVDEIVAMKAPGVGGQPGERLRNRDVITAIEGRTVRTLDDLYRVLGDYDVGAEVVVTVRRGTRIEQIPVTLVEPE